MVGESVIVSLPKQNGVDDLNNPVYTYDESTVSNVLVSPIDPSDVTEGDRPEASEVKYTLHFPKTFDKSLRGAKVCVRGEWLNVFGDPKHFTLENCPTDWWMTVQVGVFDG